MLTYIDVEYGANGELRRYRHPALGMPGTVLDAFLHLGLLDDPAEIVGIAGGDLGVAFASVLPKVKPGMERGLAGPLHEVAPPRALDQLLEDRRRDDHIGRCPVWGDRSPVEVGKGRSPPQGVAQLLIAMAVQFRPNAQGAFVGADPGTELDARGRRRSFARIQRCARRRSRRLEGLDGLGKGRSILDVFVDEVMDGGSAWRNGPGGAHQGVHRVGDTAAAHHVDARDLDDVVAHRIGAGGFDIDDADQGL